MEAAKVLLLAQGYEATSVRHIAKEASVTIGAFYGHFESKRTMLFEVVRAINVAPKGRGRSFGGASERSLLLTVASFAHSDDEAAAVLGEVLGVADDAGCSEAGALTVLQVGELITSLAR
ncbi:helix-turn-helix domain-containing protein [Nocardioides sp.]|uniref:helix-turn-helix domain-containing protein n=1 Tax=Nocardioides sp. TaxID=35761 RepID=UPI002630596B|nr:helix-turn-helix domain-containing protein [Nocardioides sp.]